MTTGPTYRLRLKLEQPLGPVPADLSGGRLARRFARLDRVHPVGDRLEAPENRFTLAGAPG
jgi:hypothetical protein